MNSRFLRRSLSFFSASPFLLFGCILVSQPALSAKPQWPNQATFDRIDGNTVRFKNEQGKDPLPLETNLYDLEYISLLKPENTADLPFVVLAARSCADCTREKEIHIIRADGGKVSTFIYPGKIRDRRSGNILLDSRAFYGKCLKNRSADVYTVFQREKVDRKRSLRMSVYVAEAKEPQLHEELIITHPPQMAFTLSQVKSEQCREIQGFNRYASDKANLYDLYKNAENQ